MDALLTQTSLVVHNDFHESHAIFPIFDGLAIKDISKPLHEVKSLPVRATTNGTPAEHATNGVSSNGTPAIEVKN